MMAIDCSVSVSESPVDKRERRLQRRANRASPIRVHMSSSGSSTSSVVAPEKRERARRRSETAEQREERLRKRRVRDRARRAVLLNVTCTCVS